MPYFNGDVLIHELILAEVSQLRTEYILVHGFNVTTCGLHLHGGIVRCPKMKKKPLHQMDGIGDI